MEKRACVWCVWAITVVTITDEADGTQGYCCACMFVVVVSNRAYIPGSEGGPAVVSTEGRGAGRQGDDAVKLRFKVTID